VAADEAEAEAAGEDAALGELAADVDELEEELQPAASPMKARPTTANRARVDR
jgi:outer membrane murein-binding lipoprotein Lpp